MRPVARIAFSVVIVAVLIGAGFAYVAISRSLHAENALHSTLLTLRLLNEYVALHDGEWPASWTDLEALRPDDRTSMYDWPEDSRKVQEYVEIDFTANSKLLAEQSIDDFGAVRSIGPYYPWKDYYEVENLLNSLKGNAVVVTDDNGTTYVLSPRQARWFANDLSGPGIESMISKYPAAALATFRFAKKDYLMHGNAVIHIDADGTERLWTGPYLQALIANGTDLGESIKLVERMPDLSGVSMDAPGAYPGGGPAPLVDPTP
jgi:hypothetical protein